MILAVRTLVLTVAWLVPLTWTTLWGVFRGAYAHGGFAWWEQFHYGGLALLGAMAWSLHLRWGGPLQRRELAALAGVSTCLLLAITWLSFQAGLAVHDLPASLGEFLFAAP